MDFNQTSEAFGYDYDVYNRPFRYWIVSKKVRSVLINELEQNDFDFIPVKIIEEKTE